MKKIVIAITLLAITLLVNFLLSNDFDKGMKAYNNGDKTKAKELFGKACNNGNIKGCYNLGFMFSNGDGVRQDKRKAKELYSKACDGGNMAGCKYYKMLNEEGI